MRLGTKVSVVIVAGLVGYTVAILAYIGWFWWFFVSPNGTSGTEAPALTSSFWSIVVSPASYPLTFVVGIIAAIIAAALVWRK